MSEDNIALSEEIKAQANQKFVEKKWHDAHDLYTKAIELNPNNSILYANRSATQLNLEAYGAAVLDATKAIETDPTYVKGYYRRGCAYVARGKYQEALQDFQAVCKLSPKDKLALNRYNECYKAMRREAFEKAIECENGKPPSETIDLSKYEIERGYEGIHVPENLSLEWILELKEFYKEQKKLHIKYIFQILLKVKEILSQTPSLVEVKVPENGKVVVYGDVHGQYYDLLNALTLSDLPSPTNILIFNGDLVDRGSWSVEVIMLILAMKATFPEYVHISRGNHETKSMNKVYGFEGEVRAKYTELCFDLFLEVFNYLPLAHVIENKVFICHGGLFSDDNVTLQDIKNINRVREPPDSGLMCELLWSDPLPDPLLGRQPSKRGVGIGFGRDVTENFLRTNGLELIVRSHEVRDNGYSVEHDGKLITIFSAPNYCDQGGNKGAIIKFEKDLKPQFVTFSHVPHPPMKPMAYSSMSNYM